MVNLGEAMRILELHREGLTISAIAERTGKDRGMRGRGSLFGGEADHERPVEPGGLRRGEVARHHDRGLRRQRRDIAQSMQGSTQLLDHVVDISRTGLKDRVR